MVSSAVCNQVLSNKSKRETYLSIFQPSNGQEGVYDCRVDAWQGHRTLQGQLCGDLAALDALSYDRCAEHRAPHDGNPITDAKDLIVWARADVTDNSGSFEAQIVFLPEETHRNHHVLNNWLVVLASRTFDFMIPSTAYLKV